MGNPHSPLSERLWSRYTVDANGCWLWTGSVGSHGYGQVKDQGKQLAAHRAAWELTYGPIPTGLHVCHRCDVKACIRPTHLFLGTQQDNVADRQAKGRTHRGPSKPHPRGAAYWAKRNREDWHRGEQVKGSKLTEAQVRAIRTLRSEGWTLQRLAAEYGVAIGTIHFIVTGKTWAHILP